MTNRHHPAQPETDLSPPLMINAAYVIIVLSLAAGLAEKLIEALPL